MRDEESKDTRAGPGPATPTGGASVGRVIGPYRIVQELGRGGQGVVYLAEDTRLARRVALKVLPELQNASGDVLRRFHREAEAASRVDHPGIATVYDTGTSEGVPFIAMRFVEGDTLAKRISTARGDSREDTPSSIFVTAQENDPAAPMPSERTGAAAPAAPRHELRENQQRILRLFIKIADALHAAHEKGIIHRDIKPQNILLGRDGQPVILDFGLARDVDSDSNAMTRAGDFFGTPAYMSPEQLLASRVKLDRRTDLWSLGVCLYECLTLHLPFEHPTREGLYVAIQTKEPPDPRRASKSIPVDLKVVLETALEKDRDRRYQTARDFGDELRRILNHEPIHARPAGPILKLRRFCERKPGLAAALAVAFLSLGAGLAVSLVLLRQARDESREKENQRSRAVAAEKIVAADRDRQIARYASLGLPDKAKLQELTDGAEKLWPATPAKVAELKAWIAEASAFRACVSGHEKTLALLDALPPEPTEGAQVERRSQIDEVRALVENLHEFFDPESRVGGFADVESRLKFAETVSELSIDRWADAWKAAIESIADKSRCPLYAGLRITPQLGLIPIGRSPKTGLWEFLHLRTCDAGADDPKQCLDATTGEVVPQSGGGIVFVLIPPGRGWIGCRLPDADHPIGSPNVDAATNETMISPRLVDFAPFFLSKFELTQGQFERCAGQNPSILFIGANIGGISVTELHPVENVSWSAATRILSEHGMRLPTDIEWEYGCRAGTTTPYWTGEDPRSLLESGFAGNLGDRAQRVETPGGPVDFEWNDGWPMHAPVGRFRPNPWGLYDIVGNVFEWCSGWHEDGNDAPVERDLRALGVEMVASARGGSFFMTTQNARSAHRTITELDWSWLDLGIRPVRDLDR